MNATPNRSICPAGNPLEALLEREELGSTGIGRGLAIPHADFPLERPLAALATFPAGVDFASLDGESVHLVCLLVGHNPGTLEILARKLRDLGKH
ncbi:MAG: PTS sugar transporter subunit IIA [Gemmataceae bacterium]